MKVTAGSHTLPLSSTHDSDNSAPRSGKRRAHVVTALAALALVFGVFAVAAPAHAADQAAVNDWLGRINALRTGRGIGALQIDANMAQLAQQRTEINAQNGVLAHTPDMAAGVTSNWTKLGENVGVGSNRDVIWQAFLNSPPHLANLLDPSYTHIGIGEVTVNGTIWVTHRFLTIGASAPAPAPAPAPVVIQTPAPAPAPVVIPQTPRAAAPTNQSSNNNSNANKSASSGGASANNGSGSGSNNSSSGGTGSESAPADPPPAANTEPATPPASPAPNAEAVVDALSVLQQ